MYCTLYRFIKSQCIRLDGRDDGDDLGILSRSVRAVHVHRASCIVHPRIYSVWCSSSSRLCVCSTLKEWQGSALARHLQSVNLALSSDSRDMLCAVLFRFTRRHPSPFCSIFDLTLITFLRSFSLDHLRQFLSSHLRHPLQRWTHSSLWIFNRNQRYKYPISIIATSTSPGALFDITIVFSPAFNVFNHINNMKLTVTSATLALAAVLGSTFTQALPSSSPSSSWFDRRQSSSSSEQGYFSPANNGGSMLTGNTASGLGEPLNVIVSGLSSAGVLNQAGFEEFSRSIDFSPGSCLNISQGGYQTANLGDGLGSQPQTNIMRYNYRQGDGGTCIESLKGGNHFRYWIQNGSAADSGAIFIAASVELNATLGHMIAPNGYDQGRDEMVGNATAGTLTSPGGFQYTVTRETNTQLLSGLSASQINHGIGIDGVVDVLTIQIVKNGTIGAGRDQSGSSGSSSGSSVSTPQAGATASTFRTINAKTMIAFSALALCLSSGLLTLV